MTDRPWPTPQMILDNARAGMLDEITGLRRPTREEREAFDAALQELLARDAAETAACAEAEQRAPAAARVP